MREYFKTENLSVGYDNKPLIENISIALEKGKILTLIGPNGSGKSTILKTIIKQLNKIEGLVYINNKEISNYNYKELAKEISVVLTDRLNPELMSCEEIVAAGRYPFTNIFGKMTLEDKIAVENALETVNAKDLAKLDFMTLSDGQKQRIMLARAICQEPKLIVLDEPTAYLDIRHKIDLLNILKNMARKHDVTVIMSLHEIDLAMKISDYLLCIKQNHVEAFGRPEEIIDTGVIENLYDMETGSYNLLFGSVEIGQNHDFPKVFVVSGGGFGINCFRYLQKNNIPFAAGILFDNDVDYYISKDLTDYVISCDGFENMTDVAYQKAAEILVKCEAVVDAKTPIKSLNYLNAKLLELAKKSNIPIYYPNNLEEIIL